MTLNASRALGIRTLLERPNAHTAHAFPRSNTHAFNPKRLAREEQEYELADRLACPSQFVAKTFLDRGFSSGRIAMHQYGYEPSKFSLPPPAQHDVGRPFAAAFVGRCEPRKGLHIALRAWLASAASTQGTFYICGDFFPGYRQMLSDMLRHPSVKVIGFTAGVEEVLRQSDVLILPSVEEGSALVTYEARACGCVLLVSDATGARCTHLADSLVHPAGDVATLTTHLNMILAEHGLLDRLRTSSLAGLPDLAWSAAAKQLYRVYEELAPMPHARPPTARAREVAL
jgi:glycosyltransferase involved in cell wall biosynthesis